MQKKMQIIGLSVVAILILFLLFMIMHLNKELAQFTNEGDIVGTYVLNGDQTAKDAQFLAFADKMKDVYPYWRYIQLQSMEKGTYEKYGPNLYILTTKDSNDEAKQTNVLLVKDILYLFENPENKIYIYKKLSPTPIIVGTENDHDSE